MAKKLNPAFRQFLEGMGIDDPEKVLDDPHKYGMLLNKDLSIGQNAVHKLKGMQERDVDAEIRNAGITPETANTVYDTVKEFATDRSSDPLPLGHADPAG